MASLPWQEERSLLGSEALGELLWGSQTMQHVLQFSPYMAMSSFASSPPQAGTHGAAGQGMKCAQCTKSQPCSQGNDMHKNKERQKHGVRRP